MTDWKFKESSSTTEPEPSSDTMDVFEILKSNRHIQIQNEKPLDLKHRTGRRKRDYWITTLVTNTIIAGSLLFVGIQPVTLVYAFSAFILFNVGFTWMMWQILSDY